MKILITTIKWIINRIRNFFLCLKNKLFPNTTYQIGIYKIQIPTSAMLPSYQNQHPLYDRFLPILAKNLRIKGDIIDIGANIGDTLIAMIQHTNNNNTFICVEPSEFYFKYLEKNTKNLMPEANKRVKLVKHFIGTGKFSGELKEDLGTGKIVIEDDSNNVPIDNNLIYKKLDDIIKNRSNIILLKCDVDGFDFDVIESAEKILLESEPILFFENQIEHDFQYEGFNKLYDFLEKFAYSYIYIFDNYGNIIVEQANYNQVRNINDYIYNMKKYHTTKTIYYTDILASTIKMFPIITKAIDDYKKNWIKR
jgi:FkbM family methyltransferase